MNPKTQKSTFSKVNPFDLSTVARVTQVPVRQTIGSTRSSDVFSAGGKNSTSAEKSGGSPKKARK